MQLFSSAKRKGFPFLSAKRDQEQQLPHRPPKRRGKVLTLELVLTDLKFGKGSASDSHGRYQPFYQITNVQGKVLGRSKIVFDCLVHAHWPLLSLSWQEVSGQQTSAGYDNDDDNDGTHCHQSTYTKRSSLSSTVPGASQKKQTNNLSPSNSLPAQNVVTQQSSVLQPSARSNEKSFHQPLLISIYDFRSNGQHVILGEITTTLQELFSKAARITQHKENQTSHSLSPQQLRKIPASFTIDLMTQHKTSSGMAKLYVTCLQLIPRGIADPVMDNQFDFSKQELTRMPNLGSVLPPAGVPAPVPPPEQRTPNVTKVRKPKVSSTKEVSKARGDIPSRILGETQTTQEQKRSSPEQSTASVHKENLHNSLPTTEVVPSLQRPNRQHQINNKRERRHPLIDAVHKTEAKELNLLEADSSLKHRSTNQRRIIETLIFAIQEKLHRLQELHEIQILTEAQRRRQAVAKFEIIRQHDQAVRQGIVARLQRHDEICAVHAYSTQQRNLLTEESHSLARLLKALERESWRKNLDFEREMKASKQNNAVLELRGLPFIEQVQTKLSHLENANANMPGAAMGPHDFQSFRELLLSMETEIQNYEQAQSKEGVFSAKCSHHMILI